MSPGRDYLIGVGMREGRRLSLCIYRGVFVWIDLVIGALRRNGVTGQGGRGDYDDNELWRWRWDTAPGSLGWMGGGLLFAVFVLLLRHNPTIIMADQHNLPPTIASHMWSNCCTCYPPSCAISCWRAIRARPRKLSNPSRRIASRQTAHICFFRHPHAS